MKDKEILPILRQISRVANSVVFTNANKVRGEKSEKLKKVFDELLRADGQNKSKRILVKKSENPIVAFKFALKNMKKEDVVVVTGSSFLVSEILTYRL
jgi:folylpolyglutamate synthase/dihydropteroate synthase